MLSAVPNDGCGDSTTITKTTTIDFGKLNIAVFIKNNPNGVVNPDYQCWLKTNHLACLMNDDNFYAPPFTCPVGKNCMPFIEGPFCDISSSRIKAVLDSKTPDGTWWKCVGTVTATSTIIYGCKPIPAPISKTS